AFLPLKPCLRWNILLYLCLSVVTGMVIWVGDNNLLFTLPPFFAVLLLCSKGDILGRLVVTSAFFCIIMTVSAILDSYLYLLLDIFKMRELEDALNRILRPMIWGGLYLCLRRRLPEQPPQLSRRLWRLMLLLVSLPLCSLLAVVLLTYNKYESRMVYRLAQNLGIAILPFVLTASLALLLAVKMLEDYERLERSERLASLRESYYQAIQREAQQVRTLRHDLRNHLLVIRGLLEQQDTVKAASYLEQMFESPALRGTRRLCENEAANVVLSAKAEEMGRLGLTCDFSVFLPGDLPVAAVDLCALLGNALDNAMEAAEQSAGKKISVRCRTEKGLFMLCVENAADSAVRPDLATTKTDRSVHGFGLSGMREIAERYGGSLETRAENGCFELVACIPLAR
ncbi:MAG: GHKL domain-containing protein, partial [Oscillospiraceae bacterium]|nr:GHKL domain-containing protein [Oscillospiraceae bacterium]